MLKLNAVMLVSTDGETVSVKMAWTISPGANALFCRFHDRFIAGLAFDGDQLLVLMLSVVLAVPMFFTQTALVTVSPGFSDPQPKYVAFCVHALFE